jgi:hypothetical protein
MAGGAVGWCGDVAMDPQMHQAAAVTLPQSPFTMPLMLPTELLARGRIIAGRSPVSPGRHLRPGEKLELRHKPFSRIRTAECQPPRRVDHAKSASHINAAMGGHQNLPQTMFLDLSPATICEKRCPMTGAADPGEGGTQRVNAGQRTAGSQSRS